MAHTIRAQEKRPAKVWPRELQSALVLISVSRGHNPWPPLAHRTSRSAFLARLLGMTAHTSVHAVGDPAFAAALPAHLVVDVVVIHDEPPQADFSWPVFCDLHPTEALAF